MAEQHKYVHSAVQSDASLASQMHILVLLTHKSKHMTDHGQNAILNFRTQLLGASEVVQDARVPSGAQPLCAAYIRNYPHFWVAAQLCSLHTNSKLELSRPKSHQVKQCTTFRHYRFVAAVQNEHAAVVPSARQCRYRLHDSCRQVRGACLSCTYLSWT